jgi:N-acetylneuraminate lyase
MQYRLRGLVAAVFTPMHQDGSLNLAQVGPLVDLLAHDGVSAVFVCGSTGEGPLLTTDERRATAAAYVEATRGRMPAVIHVGHTSPAEGRGLAAHAQQIGADAVAAVAPWYFKPASVEILVDCLAEIAAGAPRLPFYYYHIPSLTGVTLDVVEVLRVGAKRIPNLVGAKYTTTTLDEYQALVELEQGRFDVLFGYDQMLLPGLSVGAQGAIGTTYNFAAPLYRRVMENFQSGRLDEARHCQSLAVGMIRLMLRYQGLGAFKAMMKPLGIDCGPTRTPLPNPSAAQMAELERELRAMGFFDWGRA